MNRKLKSGKTVFCVIIAALLIFGTLSHWHKINKRGLLVDVLNKAEENFLEAENKFNQVFQAKPEERKKFLGETESEFLKSYPVYKDLLEKVHSHPFVSAQILFRLGNSEFSLAIIKGKKSEKAKEYWAQALKIFQTENFLINNQKFSEALLGCSANMEIANQIEPLSQQKEAESNEKQEKESDETKTPEQSVESEEQNQNPAPGNPDNSDDDEWIEKIQPEPGQEENKDKEGKEEQSRGKAGTMPEEDNE